MVDPEILRAAQLAASSRSPDLTPREVHDPGRYGGPEDQVFKREAIHSVAPLNFCVPQRRVCDPGECFVNETFRQWMISLPVSRSRMSRPRDIIDLEVSLLAYHERTST